MAKKTRKAAPRKAAPRRQQVIPGTETKAITEIDEVAEQLYEIQQRRMDLTKEEVKLRSVLKERMERHEKREYRSESTGLIAKIEGKEKAKVRRIKDESDEAEAA